MVICKEKVSYPLSLQKRMFQSRELHSVNIIKFRQEKSRKLKNFVFVSTVVWKRFQWYKKHCFFLFQDSHKPGQQQQTTFLQKGRIQPYSNSGDDMQTKQGVRFPEHLFKECLEGGKSTQGLQETSRSGTQKVLIMNNLEHQCYYYDTKQQFLICQAPLYSLKIYCFYTYITNIRLDGVCKVILTRQTELFLFCVNPLRAPGKQGSTQWLPDKITAGTQVNKGAIHFEDPTSCLQKAQSFIFQHWKTSENF